MVQGNPSSERVFRAKPTLNNYLLKALRLNLKKPLSDSPPQDLAWIANAIHLRFLSRYGAPQRCLIPLSEEAKPMSLWESCPSSALALTSQASALLEALQETLQEPTSPCTVQAPDPASGDLFFYHAMYELLHHDFALEPWTSALLESSPLTRLLHCPPSRRAAIALEDGREGSPALSSQEVRGLLSHPALPYLLGTIADHWARLPSPPSKQTFETHIQQLHTRCATLQLFLHQCARQEKLSLLTVFLYLFQRLAFQDVIKHTTNLKTHVISEKERILNAYLGLIRLSHSFDEVIQEHIIEPGTYGWSRPGEVRALMPVYSRLWLSSEIKQNMQTIEQRLRKMLG